MNTRDVKLSFPNNIIKKFTLWIFTLYVTILTSFQENGPYMYSSFIVISQVWVSSCTVRLHTVQQRRAWSVTAFQDIWNKDTATYRAWYWCTAVHLAPFWCLQMASWHCQCWFCFGQCVWIFRMKSFWTNLQWLQSEFCYVNVFWLRHTHTHTHTHTHRVR